MAGVNETSGKRVVITSVGIFTSMGRYSRDVLDDMIKGKSNFTPLIYSWNNTPHKHNILASQVSNLYQPRLSNQTMEMIEHLLREPSMDDGSGPTRFSLGFAAEAFKSAALSADFYLERKGNKNRKGHTKNERIGVIIGDEISEQRVFEHDVASQKRLGPALLNSIPGTLAREAGFTGPSYAVAQACSTGSQAVKVGYFEIREGNADIIFAGASASPLETRILDDFMAIPEDKKVMTRSHNAKYGMQPFDRDRKGFIMGEGAGILTLESLENATRRKAHIMAEIVGVGDATIDAGSPVGISSEGYESAMKNAIVNAKRKGIEIDWSTTYINAHGTGTWNNDVEESKAILNILKANTSNPGSVPVSSLKGNLGHLLSAAPAVELALCAQMLESQKVPGAKLTNVDPACANLNYITKSRTGELNYIIKNSAGFNGSYSTIILKRFVN